MTIKREISRYIDKHDLPREYQIIAETVGLDIAQLLISEVGGLQVQIPNIKLMKKAIKKYIAEHGRENINYKQLALEIPCTEKYLRKLL
jgi:hypothetical protein